MAKRLKIPGRTNRNEWGWPAFVLLVLTVSAGMFALVFALAGPGQNDAAALSFERQGEASQQGDHLRANFTICSGPNRTNCVVDGDTFWFDAGAGPRKIRISDINTPELGGAKCDYERALGERAKYRLQALLNAGTFSLQTKGRDTNQYGRDLRVVMRGGTSLGDILVTEGLAEEWQGFKRDWCQDSRGSTS